MKEATNCLPFNKIIAIEFEEIISCGLKFFVFVLL